MRIRKFSTNSVVGDASACASSSYSLSSQSSITVASSTDSSTSSPSNSSSSSNRCRGLDLLVKAVVHVSSGSVVGVPYIQRRVIRRRRRALKLNQFTITELLKQEEDEDVDVDVEAEREKEQVETNSMSRRQRRVMALPSKYQDSVLQSWRPRNRQLR